MVGYAIWPIFIWQLLDGNYFEIGVLSALIVLVSLVLQVITGKMLDNKNKKTILHWGTVFYAFGWIFKIFVLTSFQIFVVGAYHSLAAIFKNTSFDTLSYEYLADNGHYIDEYTVLREMAIQVGRVLMLLFAIFVAINFGIACTFVLAALASLFVNVI